MRKDAPKLFSAPGCTLRRSANNQHDGRRQSLRHEFIGEHCAVRTQIGDGSCQRIDYHSAAVRRQRKLLNK